MTIDGKTLRGSADRERGRAAIYTVSAWATGNRLSLGQVVVGEKTNEITAIPELLRLLDLSGALVTIDEVGCQKAIADRIREQKADYILAVKENQPRLYEEVEGAITEALEQDAEAIAEHQTEETGHGRRESRTYAIFPRPAPVDPEGQRRDLAALGIATSERVDAGGRVGIEARYYMLILRFGGPGVEPVRLRDAPLCPACGLGRMVRVGAGRTGACGVGAEGGGVGYLV